MMERWIRWISIVVVILISFVVTKAQVEAQSPEGEEAMKRLFLPNVMVPLQAPDQQGTGEGAWYQGVRMYVEWYDFQPHYTLEIGVPVAGEYTCKDIVMWNVVQRKYIPVTEGHWRDYEGWGPEFWQITKSWIARHLLEALRQGNYWAWCAPK